VLFVLRSASTPLLLPFFLKESFLFSSSLIMGNGFLFDVHLAPFG